MRLLGGLEVEGVDARSLGSRKARTLVKVLVLARGAPVSADRIADVLWGDDPPARPADQIGVLVSRLRPVLGANRLQRAAAGWSLAVDWLDLDELADRIEEAATRIRAGRHAAALAAGRAALALVRGPFLADEPDASWAEADRAAVDRAVARARVVVADAALGAGMADDAAEAAQQALDHDPYDEAALRALMRAHAAAGRPASALAAYARMRERLAEELGVDPSRDTEDLHTSILLAPDAPAVRSARVVGREEDLARLDEAFAAAAAGASGAVVVEGEAGIGKTALVEEWCARLNGAVVLAGRCDELGRDLPLQPVLDGLAAHLRDTDLDVGAVVDVAAGQAALFTNLLAVVERAGDGRPVVIVVEDVHLAGASTLEWLAFAVRRGRRLLVVATSRGPVPLRSAEVLRLGPLDLDSVRALVGDDRAHDLLARSGGNPLFLVELAAAGDGELPSTIREAVAARVEGLGEAAVTLRSAAILGASLDVDLLAGVLGVAVPVLLEHVDEGVRAGLVDTSLRFRHDLVREALVAEANAARRAYVHREAARVLRERPRADPLEVAFHAARGGDAEAAAAALVEAAGMAAVRFDAREAERLLDRAVELADGSAARVARARLRIARWDLDGAREDARAAAGAGLEVAAWVEYYARDYDRALLYADEAIERAGTEEERASCLAMSGRVLHARGDLADAEPRLARAVAAAPAGVRSFARVWLAGLRNHQGAPLEALDLVDRALVDGSWLGHPFALHQAHFFRVLALGQLGRPLDALEAIDEAQRVARASGEAGERFLAGNENTRTWVLRSLGRLGEADEISARVFASTGTTSQTMEMHCAAALDLAEGRLLAADLDGAATALELAASVVEPFRGTMAWHHRQRLMVQRARLALASGDTDRAAELARGALADASARGSGRYHALAAAVLACAAPAEVVPDELDGVLASLERRAGMEAWRITAEVAAATGVERWRRDAERRAGALVAAAGPWAESVRARVARVLSTRGR